MLDAARPDDSGRTGMLDSRYPILDAGFNSRLLAPGPMLLAPGPLLLALSLSRKHIFSTFQIAGLRLAAGCWLLASGYWLLASAVAFGFFSRLRSSDFPALSKFHDCQGKQSTVRFIKQGSVKTLFCNPFPGTGESGSLSSSFTPRAPLFLLFLPLVCNEG